jgi:conjugative transfer region protein TrbK
MPTVHTLRTVALALVGLAALAALVEFGGLSDRSSEVAVAAEVQLSSTLARCRALAPQDLEADRDCRAAWDEAQRRFLGLPPDTAGTE